MKRAGKPIAVLTAYDYLFARMLEEEGLDLLLVGDSLGQVVLGRRSTIPVTLDEMIHHASAVRRGAPNSFIVVDLPFMSFQVSVEEALRNAGRAMKEAEVEAVKVEGATERTLDVVRALVDAGIPVMGHVGLVPQSVHQLGGYRVQGRGDDDAQIIRDQAAALQAAGCFSIVLELIPSDLAATITADLTIPTIGIGAGPGCDGQVLVLYDALGLNRGFEPRFLRRFADLDAQAREGVRLYLDEVRGGRYPAPEHGFGADG
jgi:3-methyl-2-oxobutanoate hydroxymethyltransferase